MRLKRNLGISLLVGLGGGLSVYALAWGLFSTHPELGMEPRNAISFAAWAAPLFFICSLIYFLFRSDQR